MSSFLNDISQIEFSNFTSQRGKTFQIIFKNNLIKRGKKFKLNKYKKYTFLKDVKEITQIEWDVHYIVKERLLKWHNMMKYDIF